MSLDPYEQHLHDWLRGVQADARARREQQNLKTLVDALRQRGYTLRCDEMQACLIATPESGQDITITLTNAREMSPDVLVQWAEKVREQGTMKAR